LKFNSSTPAKSTLSPLLADVLRAESIGSFGGSSGNALDFVLAIHLDPKRVQFWYDHLVQAFGWRGEAMTSQGFSGWRWSGARTATGASTSAGVSNTFWVIPAQNWLLVGRGESLLPLQTQYLQEITRQGRPGPALKEHLLEMDVNLPQLAPWLPAGAPLFKPARIKFAVEAKADHFDITAQILYPEAIPWTPQPWQIPTELVRNPLISFTAGQDVAAFLNLDPDVSGTEHNPLTNQFCAWALGDLVFQSYLEWPVPNASKALQTLSSEVVQSFEPKLKEFNRGKILWQPEKPRLILSNLGIVAPYVEPAPVKEGQFLLLSLFPLSLAGKPPPPQLWTEIEGKSDLVYYDWEVTGARLQQWRLLDAILLHSSAGSDESADAAKESWLNGIRSPKGNAVTMIRRVAPNELSLVRTAPLGLTGIEWILLSDWIARSNGGLPDAGPLPGR
jgi:hypothetical protein